MSEKSFRTAFCVPYKAFYITFCFVPQYCQVMIRYIFTFHIYTMIVPNDIEFSPIVLLGRSRLTTSASKSEGLSPSSNCTSRDYTCRDIRKIKIEWVTMLLYIPDTSRQQRMLLGFDYSPLSCFRMQRDMAETQKRFFVQFVALPSLFLFYTIFNIFFYSFVWVKASFATFRTSLILHWLFS